MYFGNSYFLVSFIQAAGPHFTSRHGLLHDEKFFSSSYLNNHKIYHLTIGCHGNALIAWLSVRLYWWKNKLRFHFSKKIKKTLKPQMSLVATNWIFKTASTIEGQKLITKSHLIFYTLLILQNWVHKNSTATKKSFWPYCEMTVPSKNGILLPKLFWPTVRKNCSSDRNKNFEIRGWRPRICKNFVITKTI